MFFVGALYFSFEPYDCRKESYCLNYINKRAAKYLHKANRCLEGNKLMNCLPMF